MSPQTLLAAALMGPALPCPADLKAWNGSDPGRRLAVHRNNAVASLTDTLADTYPVTQQLVGVDFFRAMAQVFVRRSPPSSPVLVFYGDGFADFVASFEPARALPYLADVARLEMARVHACHAADADALTLPAIGLALRKAQRVDELRLSCHPSLAVVQARHAAVSLWAAHQSDEGLARLDQVDITQAESAWVLRQGLEVLVLRVTPGMAAFVAALLAQCGLAEAAASAARAEACFDLIATLRLLHEHGAFTSMELPN
jgi:hypothetical protein